MEQFDIFISIEAENVIILGHHLYFVVSALLNGVALYCLCKQAPEIQSEIKFYLYYMKLSAAIAKAFSASGLAFAYQWFITFSMLACIWRRHQALVMGRFKFGKVLNNVFIFFIFVMSCARYMFGFFANFDQSESELLIDRENLGWMRERGPHVIYRRTRETALILPLMLLASHALDNLIGIALISHVMWNIRHGECEASSFSLALCLCCYSLAGCERLSHSHRFRSFFSRLLLGIKEVHLRSDNAGNDFIQLFIPNSSIFSLLPFIGAHRIHASDLDQLWRSGADRDISKGGRKMRSHRDKQHNVITPEDMFAALNATRQLRATSVFLAELVENSVSSTKIKKITELSYFEYHGSDARVWKFHGIGDGEVIKDLKHTNATLDIKKQGGKLATAANPGQYEEPTFWLLPHEVAPMLDIEPNARDDDIVTPNRPDPSNPAGAAKQSLF
ncbi:hypothetical protein PRIPAC_76887 [Pristionchus pacificus]|uniref:NAD(P)H-hydrate epimerase n=1 Tax=Pristionchus pacificus TaxID=54126 RepID=A0A2A6CNG3_PRIPA|nr:hypothetical protein PRIPAC_76887 [Pristionchus pacificus]|eukprot:PDM79669.1 hypothetical protein PRIPAC_32248 [Pristionchus pacificus]